MVELRSTSVEQTRAYGAALAAHVQPDDLIVLTGDLGAGKTHFTQGFATGLGVEAAITSPTFNIVIAYDGATLPLLHFDLYRLEHEHELEDIDWYGLTESGAVSVVEWGMRFPAALPDAYLLVEVTATLDGTRVLRGRGVGERGMVLEGVLAQVGAA